MIIIFFGPQGSGKSTQTKLLSKKLAIPTLSAGDVSRQLKSEDTPDGRLVKAAYDRGELTPINILTARLEKILLGEEFKSGYILDGWPRNDEQADRYDKFLQLQKTKIDAILLINLSEEEGVKRLTKRAETESRSDDTPEAIKRRLQIYRESTLPIINRYRNVGVSVSEINGDQTIEQVHEEILKTLKL